MIKLGDTSDYINTTDYKKLANRLEEMKSVLEDLQDKSAASRKLRFAEVDIEVEREAGRIQPDELYIPVHTIDTNIRREQSSYIQYLVQSPRAIILRDKLDSSVDLSQLEHDLTDKLRYDGWQLPAFANVDSFQANGYGIMEVVQDLNNPGELGHEQVQLGDFAFVADTRDLQACEFIGRTYHYTKTKLLSLCGDPLNPKDTDWNREQVYKVTGKDSAAAVVDPGDSTDSKDKSLYRVQKVMFRVNGVVNVAWASIGVADDWLRQPRPLYIGRRELTKENVIQEGIRRLTGSPPPSTEKYETDYPYFLYQYLISENDTIAHLKGRVFLDQDVQEAISSLLSSTCTQARRASGFYASEDTDDPNSDVLQQKNVYFRQGCIIPKKVSFAHLDAPDPGIFSAIQLLVTGNQAETSQVNFAANNRKDSRKTAEEIKQSATQQQILSTVQVVLFSIALRAMYSTMVSVIQSRVLAGLIKVSPAVAPMYQRTFYIKPSGDVDVIEKQQMIQTMMGAWPVVQNTGAAIPFLTDLLEKMFPDSAAKYIQAITQQMQQQQSAQAQQMQQMMGVAMKMASGIIQLSKEPQMFSELGRIHALPVVEDAARQLEQVQQQLQQQNKQPVKQQ